MDVTVRFFRTVKLVFVHLNVKVDKLELPEIKFFPIYFNAVYYNIVIKSVLREQPHLVHGWSTIEMTSI